MLGLFASKFYPETSGYSLVIHLKSFSYSTSWTDHVSFNWTELWQTSWGRDLHSLHPNWEHHCCSGRTSQLRTQPSSPGGHIIMVVVIFTYNWVRDQGPVSRRCRSLRLLSYDTLSKLRPNRKSVVKCFTNVVVTLGIGRRYLRQNPHWKHHNGGYFRAHLPIDLTATCVLWGRCERPVRGGHWGRGSTSVGQAELCEAGADAEPLTIAVGT